MCKALALASLLLLPLLAQAAAKEPKTRAPEAGRELYVVGLASPTAMTSLAAQVSQRIVAAAQKQGFKVVPPAELSARLGPESYAQLQQCEGKLGCVTQQLSAGKAWVAVGVLSRNERSYLLRLWLLDPSRNRVVAEVDRAILIASRRLVLDAEEAIPRLLRGEREAVGRLELSSNVSRAELWLDGVPSGATPATLMLKPGKYKVRLEKPSYMPVERLVTVEAEKTTREEIRLVLLPNARPEGDELPPLVATQAPGAGPSASLVPTASWILGGVAVAAGGAGTYFGLRARAADERLQAGYDSAAQTWSGTRREALEARRDALYANVLLGTATAALVSGIVVAFTAPSPASDSPDASPERSTRVLPFVDVGGGGLAVQGAFW